MFGSKINKILFPKFGKKVDKREVDKKFSILKMKKSSILAKSIEKMIFLIKTKSVQSTSVFIFSAIS